MPKYIIDHDAHQNRWYVMDKQNNLLGNLSGFKSEADALNWVESDKLAPRYKCPQCKRVWKGDVAECVVCADVRAVLRQISLVKES